MKVIIEKINPANRNSVVSFIKKNWGSSIIVTRGKIHHAEKLEGFVANVDNTVKGIITYSIHYKNPEEQNTGIPEMEIVSLDSMLENSGIGTKLIDAATEEARKMGCRRVWLVTTNDNTPAIRFYQKRGFDIVIIYRFAVNESRTIKPEIPLKGVDGIPIFHEIEFEKILT